MIDFDFDNLQVLEPGSLSIDVDSVRLQRLPEARSDGEARHSMHPM
jgi:hypothetical protein